MSFNNANNRLKNLLEISMDLEFKLRILSKTFSKCFLNTRERVLNNS